MNEAHTEMNAATRASLEADERLLRYGPFLGAAGWLGILSIALAVFGTGAFFGALGMLLCLPALRDAEYRFSALAILALCAAGTGIGLWFGRWHLRALSETGFSLPPWHLAILAIGAVLTIAALGLVLVGGRVLARRRREAAEEYSDRSAEPWPDSPRSQSAPELLELDVAWRIEVPPWLTGGLAVGDWDGDGERELLLIDKEGRLHVFNAGGAEIAVIPLRKGTVRVALGHAGGEHLLACHRPWHWRVRVFNRQGKALWCFPRRPLLGWPVADAQWGDIDGDGNDELIVGRIALGGVHAVDHRGRRRWRVRRPRFAVKVSAVPGDVPSTARIAVTDMKGVLSVLDGGGKPLRAAEKTWLDCQTHCTASPSDSGGAPLYALGYKSMRDQRSGDWFRGWVVAMHTDGKARWRIPVMTWVGAGCFPALATGDLTGDGEEEIAFQSDPRVANVASATGRLLVHLAEGRPQQVVILSRKGQPGLLVLGEERQITAWQLRESPPEQEEALG